MPTSFSAAVSLDENSPRHTAAQPTLRELLATPLCEVRISHTEQTIHFGLSSF